MILDDNKAESEPASSSQTPLADQLDDQHVLQRYRRALNDAKGEHDRVLDEADEYYSAYGLNSIKGRDFADMQKVWGDHPPEIGMLLSNVNTFWGEMVSSRREPTFPGFNMSPQDEVIGEMLTLLLKAGRRWAGSDAVDEEALKDLILTGYAFTEIYLGTEERPPFRPKERHIPLDRIWWDAGAKVKNMVDAQEFIVRHPYSVDEAAARFPDSAADIRALGDSVGSGSENAGSEGARALGGPAVSVSVSADGKATAGGGKSRRLREVPVDDFQFVVWETLAQWEMPRQAQLDGTPGQPQKFEAPVEDFTAAMDQAAQAAAAKGQLFRRPQPITFSEATWYRARVLASSAQGGAKILKSAEPIPGNKRLVRPMTGYKELFKDGDQLKAKWFGFGRILLGLQRLSSVWMRILVEQEARRNRSSGAIEAGAFENAEQKRAWEDAQAMPGSWPEIPDGSFEKIHLNDTQPAPHVASMSQMFQFLAVDLVAHMTGISNMSRGTFEGDRSTKQITTMLETALDMQQTFTSAYTDYLAEGATTMARLLLLLFDPKDIDRLLGNQPLREGITAEKDPQSGQLVPKIDPATGQAMTTGAFLKAEVGEVFDEDVSFGLRASAASERLANAQMMTQHGVLDSLQQLGVPGYLLAPAFLRASFAQGTEFADLAASLETYYQQQNAQQNQAAQAATENGWVQFIQGVAKSDPQKAIQLMQAASQAMTAPPQQGGAGITPPGQQPPPPSNGQQPQQQAAS